METNKTQLTTVRDHLNKHKAISSWEAIARFRITRLSEYIRILRAEGLEIQTERKYPKTGNWYGLYKLIEEEELT